MQILKVISLLLDYPTEALQGARDELSEAIGRAREISPEQRTALITLLDELAGGDVMDETYIRTRYLDNVNKLRSYRTYPDDGRSAIMLMQTLRELETSTPSELLAATFMDRTNRAQAVGALWRLVCEQFIGVNLMNELTMSSEIWVVER